jgi:hypothetical protein
MSVDKFAKTRRSQCKECIQFFESVSRNRIAFGSDTVKAIATDYAFV